MKGGKTDMRKELPISFHTTCIMYILSWQAKGTCRDYEKGHLLSINQNLKYAYRQSKQRFIITRCRLIYDKNKVKTQTVLEKKWNLNGFWKNCLIISYYYKQICQLWISGCLLMLGYVILQWGNKWLDDWVWVLQGKPRWQ